MTPARRHARATWLAGLLPLMAQAADTAQQNAEKLKGFGLADGGSATPGLGRVILVFMVIAALAWGMAWLLRRYGARWRIGAVAGAVGVPIRPLARNSLPGGVACHLIEAGGKRVLISVSRHGVSSLLLGDAPADIAPPPAVERAP